MFYQMMAAEVPIKEIPRKREGDERKTTDAATETGSSHGSIGNLKES